MEHMNSWSSSVSRHSSTLSRRISHHVDDDAESESVSEAGDIGDRALHGRRRSEESSSFDLSFDRTPETGVIFSNPASNSISHVASAQVTPVSANGKVCSEDIEKESDEELLKILDYVSCLIHLAVFGILGVLTRYLLQKLFGPKVAGLTNDKTILYPDLPSNMVLSPGASLSLSLMHGLSDTSLVCCRNGILKKERITQAKSLVRFCWWGNIKEQN